MDLGLNGKYAIVTGGTGICRATALSLAKEGANVAVTYLTEVDEEASQHTVKEILDMGLKAINIKMDLLKLDDIKSMVNEVMQKFGRIDILINAAASVHPATAEEITEKDWNEEIDIDLKGLFFCAKEVFLKAMKPQKSGNILNVASVVGMRPAKTNLAYGAAKSGVIHITQHLAVEWGPYNVRVNSLSPGWIATKLLLDKIKIGKAINPTVIMPLGRLGTAEEMADLITFLVSERNGFMTGANIVSDGGILSGIRLPSIKEGKLDIF